MFPRAQVSGVPIFRSKVKVTGLQKYSQLSGVMFTYGRSNERPLLRLRLQGGRGLEFPSVTQPVAIGRTAAYRVGADIFCLLVAY